MQKCILENSIKTYQSCFKKINTFYCVWDFKNLNPIYVILELCTIFAAAFKFNLFLLLFR